MNKVVNKFLLVGDKSMSKFELTRIYIHCLWVVNHLLKQRKNEKIERNTTPKTYLSKRSR